MLLALIDLLIKLWLTATDLLLMAPACVCSAAFMRRFLLKGRIDLDIMSASRMKRV